LRQLRLNDAFEKSITNPWKGEANIKSQGKFAELCSF